MENNNIKSINDQENNKEKENDNKKKTFFPISDDLKNIIFYSVLLILTIVLCYYFYVCSQLIPSTNHINILTGFYHPHPIRYTIISIYYHRPLTYQLFMLNSKV